MATRSISCSPAYVAIVSATPPLKHLGHRLDSPVGSAVRDRLDDLLALAFEYVDNLAVDPCDAVVGRVGDVENVDGRAVIGRDIEDVIERGARPVAAVGREQDAIEHAPMVAACGKRSAAFALAGNRPG